MKVFKRFSLICFILVSLFSCNKAKQKLQIRKYDGYWKLVEVENVFYDINGQDSTSSISKKEGSLKLSKKGTYQSEGIAEIASQGDWFLSYYGKRDVIIFKNNRATISQKSRKKMTLEFSTGKGNGMRYSHTTYTFEFDKEIDYKEEENLKFGVSFKDASGKEYFYESNQITTKTETNWNDTKYVTILDFINSKENAGDAKYLRIKLVGNATGFANTAYTWNAAWSDHVINYIEFWDNGSNPDGVISASFSSDMVITENDLLNQKSVKASIGNIDFSETIPSLGTNKLSNLQINMQF